MVLIPDGVYLVDAGTSLRPRSKVTLRLSQGAILRAMPGNLERSAVVMISGVQDVSIDGGTIEGDRDAHLGSTGEWGMGIQFHGARSVAIEGVTVREAWGDGVYIGGNAAVGASANVTICGLTSDKNRRQGLSAVHVDGLIIRDSVFRNTSGTRPELGIDIEPNPGQNVRNVSISGSVFSGNAGGGVAIALDPANKATASIDNVVLRDNVIVNNGRIGAPRLLAGVSIAGAQSTTIAGNRLSDNIGVGIVDTGSSATLIEANVVTGVVFQSLQTSVDGAGVSVVSGTGVALRRNVIRINQGPGVWIPDARTVLLEDNLIASNGN